MGFAANLTLPPISRSATQIVFMGESGTVTQTVALSGSGFTYNAQGLLTGGTITRMDLREGATLLETVSVPNASAATLSTNVLSKVSALATQIGGWNLADFDDMTPPLVTASQIRIKLIDNTYLQVVGNLPIANPESGTVTAIRHLAANGTTVLHSATGLPMPAGVAFMVFGEGEAVYDALVTGANVVSGVAHGGENILWYDGGPGNDWLIGKTTTNDYLDYESATSGVVVNFTTGKATGGGGSDSFFHMDGINASGYNDYLIGNAAGNSLFGMAGNDIINAAAGNDNVHGDEGNDTLNGGFGLDILSGGLGADTFVFNTTPSTNYNSDTIQDFSPYWDTIKLENAVFTALGTATGQIADATFHRSSTGLAQDASDRIIYNTSTGVLNYDTNGNAAGGVIQIATLFGAPNVTADDIVII